MPCPKTGWVAAWTRLRRHQPEEASPRKNQAQAFQSGRGRRWVSHRHCRRGVFANPRAAGCPSDEAQLSRLTGPKKSAVEFAKQAADHQPGRDA